MSKYPKVNYIGNKEKIAKWIIECFPINQGRILDLFSGGCSFSYALKKSGFEVLTNDVLYSNYCISKAIIENSDIKLDLNIDEELIGTYYSSEIYEKINWLVDCLYFEHEVKELASLISFSQILKGSQKYLFLALLRRAMVRKIPYSRMNIRWEEIVKLRDEELSYQKYKRRRAYHNKSFLFHIKDNLKDYNSAVLSNGYKNKSYQKDALDMLRHLRQKVDIIYIDPPYPSTMNKYEEFYGAFDIMFDKRIPYTDFTKKDMFLQNLRNIVELSKGKTRYTAISLNNKSNPSYQEIIENVRDIIYDVSINKKNHIYKVTGKQNKRTNYEVLMLMEV